MSVKEIIGLATVIPNKENPRESLKEELQAGNIAFRSRTLARTLAFWNNNNSGSNYGINLYPFKQGNLLDDNDVTVGHALWFNAATATYPANGAASQATMATFDYSKFRATGSIGTITSGLLSRVHAGIAAYDNLAGAGDNTWGGNSLVSASDLPADYTQIGVVYAHPMYLASSSGQSASNTQLVFTAGNTYATFTNAGWWDQAYIQASGGFCVLRIASGADAGFYFIQNVDFNSNRLYLRNLNGTPFVSQGSATIPGTDLYLGPGRQFHFNEVSIIPFSTGTVVASGRYQPGYYAGTTQPLRTSFIARVTIDKTGSTEVASAAEQQGSYVVSMLPWTHGDYNNDNAGFNWALYRATWNEGNGANFPGHTFPYAIGGGGGANAMILDENNQRAWAGVTNANNDSCIIHWRWRTIESPREVANYLGTAGHASFLTPQVVLGSGDRIRGGSLGSNQWVYFAVQHPTLGNGGLIIIRPDLTTRQYTEDQGGASWAGTGDTIGGTAPNMTLSDAGAVFNATMVGQSITLAGATTGANNGTFLITGYTSPTQITYQNLVGVAEAFPGTWTRLGVPDSNVAAVVVDKTATRAFAGDTVAASNTIDNISGTTMTSADIGRVIRVTGADAGIYKIATVVDGNTITVTTLAGSSVSFTGDGGIDLDIGDRAYLLFNNNTTGLNKINYMESLAPGTFLERTFTSTDGLGANCNVQAIHGENQRAAIDPANGNLYWLSNDTTQRINKYNVATNAHTAILITNTSLLSPAGGVVFGGASPATNPATPTNFNNILVNSKFDEIWVGSDAGAFKILKSTFAPSSIKRYYGTENTTYTSGTPLTTGTGNGTTGLSFSTPNVTLNATGTPFVATDVGKWIVITGASTAANNGAFLITAVNSSSQLVYTNASGATQANYAGTFHICSAVHQRSNGSAAAGGNSQITRGFWEQPDGRVQVINWAGNTTNCDFAYYGRDNDSFYFRTEITNSQTAAAGRNMVFDSIGWCWDLCYNGGNAGSRMWLRPHVVDYQWTGSAWTPRQHARTGMPNKSFADTTNPLLAARPIHSTAEDLMYGVKIQFNRQGGATPANNEFLGRFGQTRTTSADGATTTGSANFDGSGFVAGDAGRTLRIESGADAGIYRINTFVNAGRVTLKTLTGATFSAGATAGTLTYTIWDAGSPGSNAGPEEMSFILADGVSKDNTQDVSGFTYEAYHFKTRLHENDENRKFCVENPLAVPGTLATKVYWENYPRQTAQYDAPTAHHLALPASEHANGRQALDGIMGKYLDGNVAHGLMYSHTGTSGTAWQGTNADNNMMGWSLMVDFGTDVQVGYAILRVKTFGTDQRLNATNTGNGLRAAIYKANSAGGTPAGSVTSRGVGNGTSGIAGTAPTMTLNASASQFTAGDVGRYVVITGASNAANNGVFPIVTFNSATSINYTNASGVAQANYAGQQYVVPTANVRTTGTTNFNVSGANVTTATVSSGDFLGPITLTPTTPAVGQITAGQSTLTDTTNAQFLASHVGQILKITAGAGADIGSYRIIGFTSSSVITIRNLDQTDKVWTVSSSTVTYEIRDGVRAEDMLLVQGHRLCVERLLTPTSLELRMGPNATITNQNWVVVAPSWSLVKKISHSTEAVPPDVKNNGTWVSTDGREQYDFTDAKVYADFSDLASAARTGRYWKFAAIPRFNTDVGRSDHQISTWEFYDVSGNRLATSSYSMVDEARTNADFFFNHINRFDLIQGANDALSGISGFNGNVNLGGANGDTLTLTTGGNKFLGFQIGPALSDGNLPIGTNQINSASSNWPASAMPGRMIRITSGTNAGNFYRVATRPSATQITVTTPSGGSVSWAGTESSIAFSVHEGFNVGGTSPDKFTFLEDGREFTLLTINDALTSITISETLQPSRTNKTWEIRRPGYDTTSATTEATKSARLVRPLTTYPVQSGDLAHDSRGCYRFLSEDIGTGFQRADGVIPGGSGAFTGTGFSPDDVGRLLYITTGANAGIYEISVYTSATSITVKNHYTGAAVSFTADAGPVTYQIYGDRRFRLTRFVVGLRA